MNYAEKSSDAIRQLAQNSGMSITQLALKIGIPQTSLNAALKSKKGAPIDHLIKIADFFNTTVPILCGEQGTLPATPKSEPTIEKYHALDSHGKEVVDSVICIEYDRIQKEKGKPTHPLQELERVETRKIPVESSLASAGRGYDLSDSQEGRKYITIENTLENSRADYAAYVTGSSMEPKIYDGDLLLIREQPAVNIGEFGLFCIRGVHDHGVVKEYASDRLISLNPEYDDIYFDALSETEEVVCVGKVVNIIHDYDPEEFEE